MQNILYLDGGMGTLLQSMGLRGGERPERWNILHPDKVLKVHAAYLAAGCDIVTANTFGATRAHLGDEAEACMRAGVRLARQAVMAAGRGRVAADMGSLGRLLRPYGDLDAEQAIAWFREAFVAALEEGADMMLIETMTDLGEARACALAAREAMELVGRRAPLWVSLTFEPNGRLLTGADVETAAATLCGMRVDALGVNCGHEPSALWEVFGRLAKASTAPVFAQPNASLPVVENGVTTFPINPEAFAYDMARMAELGAFALGGCCGTTPEHIRALVKATKEIRLAGDAHASRAIPATGDPHPAQGAENTKPETPAHASRAIPATCDPHPAPDAENAKPETPAHASRAVVTGNGRCLALGERPVIIGERLNPTGKARMKQALRDSDMDYLMREALNQLESGADALDLNVGLPGIDEADMLSRAVQAVQSVTDAPLQLDTADPKALEAALRVYVGKPLINSVCGKRAVMDAVFPLAAKYGGVLVALTLDEDGIPATVEGRLDIARRIIGEAERYGIGRDELIFDALTMTVATDAGAARATLETVRRLKSELGVLTVLGVSNVSFGLPQRPLLTGAFIAMALENGLDAAILNPGDLSARAAFLRGCAFTGKDAGFGRYLEAFGAQGLKLGVADVSVEHAASEPVKAARDDAPDPLWGHIRRGLPGDAAQAAKAMLAGGAAPLDVMERSVMPALGEVGEKFEKGVMFLPQLMQSAAAAQAAFDELRAAMPQKEADGGPRVVLATVEGDVHDIGKNIVKVLLQNYGFSVIDLGRDVPPQKVADAARESGARLVGLSALMTTTVPAMEKTIALIKKELPGVRVMVGGAVLTEDYAKRIGADYYAKDAMGSVRVAQGVFAG